MGFKQEAFPIFDADPVYYMDEQNHTVTPAYIVRDGIVPFHLMDKANKNGETWMARMYLSMGDGERDIRFDIMPDGAIYYIYDSENAHGDTIADDVFIGKLHLQTSTIAIGAFFGALTLERDPNTDPDIPQEAIIREVAFFTPQESHPSLTPGTTPLKESHPHLLRRRHHNPHRGSHGRTHPYH